MDATLLIAAAAIVLIALILAATAAMFEDRIVPRVVRRHVNGT